MIPDFLNDIIEQPAYERWLSRKAAAHFRRDKKYGNTLATAASYRAAIHEAVLASKGKDSYTGEDLDWTKLSKYSNEDSKKGRRLYKAGFALLPTVDHVDERSGLPNFKICSWRTNDAKGDLSVPEFIELCRRVLAHNQPSQK